MTQQSSSDRLIEPRAEKDEVVLDLTLRPQHLGDFVGQEQLKQNLLISIQAAKKRGEPLEHILLSGNPGLGKTTLASIVAREMGASIKITSGPALEKVGDLAAILSNLQAGEILFIDEIHRMNKSIEEILYPALEDYSLDIILGKGPAARSIRLPLNRFKFCLLNRLLCFSFFHFPLIEIPERHTYFNHRGIIFLIILINLLES